MVKGKSWKQYFRAIFWAILAIFLAQRFNLQIIRQIYPWILLWTPYREETLAAWKKYAPIDHSIRYPPRPIPEIQAEGILLIFPCLNVLDYTIEVMIRASEGFRRPVVIRYVSP